MLNCPKCASDTLVETSELGIPLDVCPGCSGILFDKGELEALLKKSPDGGSAGLDLINPKAEGLVCPRCKHKMSHGGLVNPLLLVDKCQSCGSIWLDARELELAKKLLGLAGGDTEVKVARLAASPAGPQGMDGRTVLVKLVSAAAAILGLIGVSYEMYLYFSPAVAVSRAPSAGLAVASVLFFAGGVLALNWGRGKGW